MAIGWHLQGGNVAVWGWASLPQGGEIQAPETAEQREETWALTTPQSSRPDCRRPAGILECKTSPLSL